jgi:hypothetical protein
VNESLAFLTLTVNNYSFSLCQKKCLIKVASGFINAWLSVGRAVFDTCHTFVVETLTLFALFRETGGNLRHNRKELLFQVTTVINPKATLITIFLDI